MADQVKSGKVMDITDAIDGHDREPRRLGRRLAGRRQAVRPAVQPRHRRLLVQQGPLRAGRHHRRRPRRWTSSTTPSSKLKAAGITPIAVGGKDKWPDAFYWDYFATASAAARRRCSEAGVRSLDGRPVLRQGRRGHSRSFIDTEPFQEGFLATPAQQGAASSAGLLANGKAAMELQGHWNPGVMAGLTAGQEAARRQARLVPVPDGRRRRRRTRRHARRRRRVLLLVQGAAGVRRLPQVHRSARSMQTKFGALNVGLPVAKGTEARSATRRSPACSRPATRRRTSSSTSTWRYADGGGPGPQRRDRQLLRRAGHAGARSSSLGQRSAAGG